MKKILFFIVMTGLIFSVNVHGMESELADRMDDDDCQEYCDAFDASDAVDTTTGSEKGFQYLGLGDRSKYVEEDNHDLSQAVLPSYDDTMDVVTTQPLKRKNLKRTYDELYGYVRNDFEGSDKKSEKKDYLHK